MPHKGQSWTPWEYQMIGEWVKATFPDAEVRMWVRLGPVQPRMPDGTFTKDEARMLGIWRRQADAVVILSDRLLVVEAGMKADPGKLAMLKLYGMLVPQTPELQEFADRRIQLVYVFAIEDPVASELARREGILPVLFVPSNFDTWLATLRERGKRAPRSPF